ncbi:MAG: hypothetical protein Q8Q09_18790 [Deltaproteobacteria bacterium]|nr:hypothetical protein [Deltaproteobacteria bacterium]
MKAHDDVAFAGVLGSTQREVSFVPTPDGGSRRVELVVSLNTATDPALAEAATAGTLHRVENLDLAVVYVFHDPVGQRFTLVIPSTRAHESLALRAEFLKQLANERVVALPAYVREAHAVVGAEGLRKWLAEPDPRVVAAREATLLQREERLLHRAEEITRREDDVRERLEEFDLERATVTRRAEELAQQELVLIEQSRSVEDSHAQLRDEWNQLAQARDAMAQVSGPQAANVASLGDMVTRAQGDVSQPFDLTPRSTSPILEAPPPLESVPEEMEPLQDAEDALLLDATPIEADLEPMEAIEPMESTEALEPMEAIEPMESSEDLPLDGDIEPLAESEMLEALPLEAEIEDSSIEPTPLEADIHWLSSGRDARAAVVDGEVRVWLRGDAKSVHALSHSDAVPVLEASPEAEFPLVLLSVVTGDGAQRLGRALLDLTHAEDRAVLDALSRESRVRVEVISRDGRALGGHALAMSGGEAHARMLVETVGARLAGDSAGRSREADRMLREGVAYTETDESWERALRDEQLLATAAGVDAARALLDVIAEPEARGRWQMARGVSTSLLENLERRALFAMLRMGVVLSPALIGRALALSIAGDSLAFAGKALMAFTRTCVSGVASVGLSRADAYRRLSGLVQWAAGEGLVGEQVAIEVYDELEALWDPENLDGPESDDPRAVVSDAELKVLSDAELRRWCLHPKVRAKAALLLAARDAQSHALLLGRVLRAVTPKDAAPILAEMLRKGDELGDAWVDLASSSKPTAAAAAAVAIAKIRLRRGLLPMIQRALSHEATEAQLYGWAVGEFGAGAVRALTESMVDGGGIERTSWILAHVVRGGGGREVERVRQQNEGSIAQAAMRAVGAVDDAREYDSALRSGRGITPAERAAAALIAALQS